MNRSSFSYYGLATLVMLVVFTSEFAVSQTKSSQAISDAEELVLETSDKIKLKCTYFAPPANKEGQKGGSKETVPMILLHDWDGDRTQLLEFGQFLQKAGHAVIVPDLRGHGQSLSAVGVDKELNYKRFRPEQIYSVQNDIEQCKRHLIKQHNEGIVNINLLTVLAIGDTSSLALQWSINDWFAYPAFNDEGIKQGQDVKALILVSPPKRMGKLKVTDQLKHDLFVGKTVDPLTLMIVWGRDEPGAKDAKYLYERLKKARPDLSEIEDKVERQEKQTLFGEDVKTDLSGVEMFKDQKIRGLWGYINKFVKSRVATKIKENEWRSRKKK